MSHCACVLRMSAQDTLHGDPVMNTQHLHDTNRSATARTPVPASLRRRRQSSLLRSPPRMKQARSSAGVAVRVSLSGI